MPQITKNCLIFPQISCDKVVHFLFTHTYFLLHFSPVALSCHVLLCSIKKQNRPSFFSNIKYVSVIMKHSQKLKSNYVVKKMMYK